MPPSPPASRAAAPEPTPLRSTSSASPGSAGSDVRSSAPAREGRSGSRPGPTRTPSCTAGRCGPGAGRSRPGSCRNSRSSARSRAAPPPPPGWGPRSAPRLLLQHGVLLLLPLLAPAAQLALALSRPRRRIASPSVDGSSGGRGRGRRGGVLRSMLEIGEYIDPEGRSPCARWFGRLNAQAAAKRRPRWSGWSRETFPASGVSAPVFSNAASISARTAMP